MTKIIKHVGILKDGGTQGNDPRIAVVFNTLPDNPEKSLVINLETMNHKLRDTITGIIETIGQEHRDLGQALSRRRLEGSSVNILTWLHNNGLLKAVPIDSVIMTPRPKDRIPLKDIVSSMSSDSRQLDPRYDNEKYNAPLSNQQAQKTEGQIGDLQNRIRQAEMLEQDARRLREQVWHQQHDFPGALAPAGFATMATQKPTQSIEAVDASMQEIEGVPYDQVTPGTLEDLNSGI